LASGPARAAFLVEILASMVAFFALMILWFVLLAAPKPASLPEVELPSAA